MASRRSRLTMNRKKIWMSVIASLLTPSVQRGGEVIFAIPRLGWDTSSHATYTYGLGPSADVLKREPSAQPVHHGAWQYVFAIANVAVALAITHWLEPYTTLRTTLFFFAVIASAWVGGKGPGFLAVALSTLLVAYYFAPGFRAGPSQADSWPFVLLFSLSIFVACWITVQRRRAEDRKSTRLNSSHLKLSRMPSSA